MRIKELVDCQIQTQDLDLFMRILKQFYINNYKKLYQQFLDYLLQFAVTPSKGVKFAKKDVFKFINEQSDQNVYSCFLLLALLIS